MPLGIPLAWRQLSAQKLRLCAAVAGITVASVMMMMQLGFRDALFRSNTLLHERLNGDLVMVSRRYQSLISAESFPRGRLEQTLGSADVASVASVCVGGLSWKNPETMQERDIFVIGIQPDGKALMFPDSTPDLEQLKLKGVVLFDAQSRKEFGPIEHMLSAKGIVSTELGGNRVRVGGVFRLGSSFAADGNLLTSDATFRHLLSRANGPIDIGLVRLRPGVDAGTARNLLASWLPADVRLFTRPEYIQLERQYWADHTPIGFVFMAGMVVAFLVGAVIVYQILYTDVVDHLKEYATLKAIGYTDRFLFGVVMQEAGLLSVFGFLPGCGVSLGIFALTRRITLLPAYFTADSAALVLLLTVTMCLLAGYCAIGRLKSADPAEIF